MFTYKLPKLNIELNIKILSIVATLIYIVTTVPLLVVGLYNWPSADDMSMALECHMFYKNSGSFLLTILYAFRVAVDEYMSWTGYFFSDIMTSYSPSVFDENLYFLVPFEMLAILTFGVCYFYNALFVRAFKADRYSTNIAAMLTLTVIVQCMPKGLTRVEAFYWYSGAINYMFMFGMALFWLGLVIKTVCEDNPKRQNRKLFWACFWGFWIGGANYMTALQCAICSCLIIMIVILNKAGIIKPDSSDNESSANYHGNTRQAYKMIWLPACINLLGFLVSCLAPGNSARSAGVQGFGPLKAILISILYTFNLLINEFTRWEILAAAAIMIVLSWKIAHGIKRRFEHPFVFVVFAFGMCASNMVPPLFALANIGAGRIRSIVFAEYILMMMLTVFYVTVWAYQSIHNVPNEEPASTLSTVQSQLLIAGIAFMLFGSTLCVYDDPQYFSASAAIADVVSGDAVTYLKENRDRLEILRDTSVKDAVLKPYSKRPSMLVFDDITEDKEYWINIVMARYYEKDSVALGGTD